MESVLTDFVNRGRPGFEHRRRRSLPSNNSPAYTSGRTILHRKRCCSSWHKYRRPRLATGNFIRAQIDADVCVYVVCIKHVLFDVYSRKFKEDSSLAGDRLQILPRYSLVWQVAIAVGEFFYTCSISAVRSQCVSHRHTRQVSQLFTYLLTHNLFSFCIRRYLVSRACD